jgi:hypothetical protein
MKHGTMSPVSCDYITDAIHAARDFMQQFAGNEEVRKRLHKLHTAQVMVQRMGGGDDRV